MITICTASNGVYREIMDRTSAKALELDYRMDTYDLGGLGYGTKYNMEATPGREHLWKPQVMRLSRAMNDGPLVWLDADALLVGSIDDAFDEEYDVGIILRPDPKRPKKDGHTAVRLDTGAIYFHDTDEAYELLKKWVKAQDAFSTGNDITPLTTFLDVKRNYYTDSLGKVHNLKGFKIRFMEQKYGAYCKTPKDLAGCPKDSKVLHFFRSDGLSGWDRYLTVEHALETGAFI